MVGVGECVDDPVADSTDDEAEDCCCAAFVRGRGKHSAPPVGFHIADSLIKEKAVRFGHADREPGNAGPDRCSAETPERRRSLMSTSVPCIRRSLSLSLVHPRSMAPPRKTRQGFQIPNVRWGRM